jgi:hypothetical protein
MKKSIIGILLLAAMLVLPSCDTPDGSSAASAPDSTTVTSETVLSADTTETTASTTAEAATETTESATASETETTAEPETTAATTEMKGAPDADFSSIAGLWYIDGDPAAASIHIDADGHFKSFYASGSQENEGIIRLEPEEIEGTVNYWYNLYSKDGEFILGFLKTDSDTDLYVGNGAFPHYKKIGAGILTDTPRNS